MSHKIGFVMDPLESITIYKDSTFAMMLEAQSRGWQVYYIQPHEMWINGGRAWSRQARVTVMDDSSKWYEIEEVIEAPLDELQAIFMRKDPPINMAYFYSTYILELAELAGTLVVNRAAALRDVNEKLSIQWFPQCMPPTLVSADQTRIKAFLQEHGEMIIKPPEGMGGDRIFYLRLGDKNVNAILEFMTGHGKDLVIAQQYVPQISQGDKRILLVDGKPAPYALARVPKEGESRGNLAAGGSGVGVKLSPRDVWICEQIAPKLREKGLIFVGIDVIGDYLTEINVTSPTCIRELEAQFGLTISADLMDWVASRLSHS